MSDPLKEVHRYFLGIDPPDAKTLEGVSRRLSSAVTASGANRARTTRRRRIGAVRWAVALVIVLAVGVALLVPTGGGRTPKNGGHAQPPDRWSQLVFDDVNATVAAGSYDMTFSDTMTSPDKCPGPGTASATPCLFPSEAAFPAISGHGTVDTNPYAMVTESDVGSLGEITLYDNGTDVWEIGGGDYGLSAPGEVGPGAPLSGYAGSVEGTVGQVQGALDMQGLASGTGYLDLEVQEIQGTQSAGTGSVDGVPVTIYKLSQSGLQDPNSSGLTTQQIQTIQAADTIIENSGFAGKTTWVSIDSEGYIREQKTEYTLPDGSMVTADTVLSNFGCAGTVLMPGQSGSSAPPSGCVSPDHAAGESAISPGQTPPPGPTSTTTTPTDTTASTTAASSLVAPTPDGSGDGR